MLTLRRVGVLVGLTALGVLGVAMPAVADDGWGSTTCDQTPAPVCDLGAGAGGSTGSPGGESGDGSSEPGPSGSGDSGNGGDNGDSIVGDPNLADCSYVRSDYRPPPGAVTPVAYTPPSDSGAAAARPAVLRRPVAPGAVLAQPVAAPGQGRPGAWYVWRCAGEGVADALYRPPVWIPDGQQPGAVPLPSPAELAAMARKQLRLPTPAIAANPAGDQLVNLPTWMWLSSGWRSVSATASVPGVSVTAVARPTSVSWSMGDGATVTCTGAGTAYRPGSDPAAPSPDCGHTYRTSSASQAGQAFPVTATVHWTVTWSGAEQGGTFPGMTTTGDTAFRVAESQALNNGGG